MRTYPSPPTHTIVSPCLRLSVPAAGQPGYSLGISHPPDTPAPHTAPAHTSLTLPYILFIGEKKTIQTRGGHRNVRTKKGTATNPLSDTLQYVISDKHHNATNIINNKRHNATNVISDIVAYDVCHLCQIITFVAYDICRIIGFVPYDVCRLIGFAAYEVCRIMTFVANYDVSRLEDFSPYPKKGWSTDIL